MQIKNIIQKESGQKILIVEDERIVAEDIRRSLESLGYKVPAIVSSGVDAINHIKKDHPDLVLMDIVIQGQINGIKTATQIRNQFDIPVIYLTAYADESMLNKAKMTEPYGYILKPFEDKDLQSTIEIGLYKHKMERKVRDNEAWLSTILKSIGDAIIATDKQGKIIFMNPMAEDLIGWRQKNLEGRPLKKYFNIVNEETRKAIKDPVNEVLEHGNSIGLASHTVLITRSGKEIPIDDSAAPILDIKGNTIGVVLVFHDITERRKAEKALQKTEKEKAIVLSSIPELVSYQDMNYKIIWVNDAAAQVAGVDPEKLIGRICYRVWYNRSKPCKNCAVKKIMKMGESSISEVTLQDGRVWSVKSYPVFDEKNKMIGVVEVTNDITEQKKLESEKETIQAQLYQAQKMEAIGTLTGGVAHDFNNLLTAIQGCTDMAIARIEKSNPIYHDLSEVQMASLRAADLTHQLLLFSRKLPVEFKITNLNGIIQDTLKMLHRLIGEDITISTSLDPDLWSVRADWGTLNQVIMNLAINARDAMLKGGTLVIQTENVLLDDSYVRGIPNAKAGRFVRLKVQDTGSGMDAEVLQHIFEPFFSTKLPRKGTGLGLSVVYGIVQQHNGWIKINSEVNKGSTFDLYFPAILDKPVDERKDNILLEKLKGKNERVLIVEDAEGVREFATMALNENGYHAVAVSNVSQALEVIKKEEKEFSLIFSDVVLPDRSGIELIDQVLISYPNLKILMSSGYTDQKSYYSIIKKRGIHFLKKPYSLIDLLKSVKKVLSG